MSFTAPTNSRPSYYKAVANASPNKAPESRRTRHNTAARAPARCPGSFKTGEAAPCPAASRPPSSWLWGHPSALSHISVDGACCCLYGPASARHRLKSGFDMQTEPQPGLITFITAAGQQQQVPMYFVMLFWLCNHAPPNQLHPVYWFPHRLPSACQYAGPILGMLTPISAQKCQACPPFLSVSYRTSSFSVNPVTSS